MKILLAAVNAKYIHSNLAVYSLRANAGKFKEEICLREYTINQQEDEILRDIWKCGPQLIFFSCYIWNRSVVRQLVEDVRQLFPQVPIWVGGPEVSYDAAGFLLGNPAVTGVLKGEGEETFYELLRHYEEGILDLGEIAGLTFRRGEEIVENPWREILDLSEILFPYESLDGFEHKIIYYESSRGCPFSCSYCLSSIDKKLRFRDLSLVKKELQFFIDREVPQVKFVDRTFNCSHSHALEIWRYIKEHDRGITNFHFEIAADLLNEEEIALLSSMRPGLVQLEIGVQSTNPKTIKEIRRKMDFQKVAEHVRLVQAAQNIHQHLDLIAGLPYEDYDSFAHSFDEVFALRPEQLQLGFLKVLKGSYMAEMAESYGCRFKKNEPYEVLQTKWLSYGDILRLKQVESMVEVYYNSGQFTQTLDWLLAHFERPFSFFQRLGEFYESRGYEEISHSRMRRYDILLEFVREINEERSSGDPQEKDESDNKKKSQGDIQKRDERNEIERRAGETQEKDREKSEERSSDAASREIDENVLKEKMTLDLYEREHLKSRPRWMADQQPWQKDIREYIRKRQLPKTVHIEVLDKKVLLFHYEQRNALTHNAKVEDITEDFP